MGLEPRTVTARYVTKAHQYHMSNAYRGIVRAGGCPAVVAQWQSTGSSSQRCPGFNSW